jgi:hypothetical protein
MLGSFRRSQAVWCGVWCAATFGMAGATAAQTPSGPSSSKAPIYTCVAADGRRFTSDRPIAECYNREQRVLNSDGSLRYVVPAPMTSEERATKEAHDRKAEMDRLALQDAARRDRNLMLRYPDEATHQRAREAALDTVRMAMRTSEQRVKELGAERKPLVEEAEFYKNKPLPPKLKQQIDANEAATEAQRNAAQNQQAELERVNRLYDTELGRLRKLWAGATPGTLAEASGAKSQR